MAKKNKATPEQREEINRLKLEVQEAADRVFRLKQQEIENGWNVTGSGYTKAELEAEYDKYLSPEDRNGDGDIYHKKMPIEKSYRNSSDVNQAIKDLQTKRESLQQRADKTYGTTSKKEGMGWGSVAAASLVTFLVVASIVGTGGGALVGYGLLGLFGFGVYAGYKSIKQSLSESGNFSKGQPNYDLSREGKSGQDTNRTEKMNEAQRAYEARKKAADDNAFKAKEGINKIQARSVVRENTGFFKEFFNERGGVLEAFAKHEGQEEALASFKGELEALKDTLEQDPNRYESALNALDSGNIATVQKHPNPHIQAFLAAQKDNPVMKKWSQNGARYKSDMHVKAGGDQSVSENEAAKRVVDSANQHRDERNAPAAIQERKQARQAAARGHQRSRLQQDAASASLHSSSSHQRRTSSRSSRDPSPKSLDAMNEGELRDELRGYREARTQAVDSARSSGSSQVNSRGHTPK